MQPPSGGLSAFSAQNSVQPDRMGHRRTHRPYVMPTKAQVIRNELLTVEELAALLKVPPKTIYAWR